MILPRLAAGCGALLLVSACSRLLHAPAQYAALPVSATQHAQALPPAGREVALPSVVIPGQFLAGSERSRLGAVEPYAALRQSEHRRLAWSEQRPGDLLKPTLFAGARAVATGGPGSTGAVPHANPAPSTGLAPEGQDREARIDKLLDRGSSSVRALCGRC